MDHKPSVSYSRHIFEVVRTDEFHEWIANLKDKAGRLRILNRIERLADGNPGDVQAAGHGVSELRLTYGPGYRVYYLQDAEILILLCGGDKSSQQKDIEKAQELAEQWRADKASAEKEARNGPE